MRWRSSSPHDVIRLLSEIRAEAGIKHDVLSGAFDFEIVLDGVGGIDVGGGNGGLEFLSAWLHGNGLEALALINVAVIEAHGLR